MPQHHNFLKNITLWLVIIQPKKTTLMVSIKPNKDEKNKLMINIKKY